MSDKLQNGRVCVKILIIFFLIVPRHLEQHLKHSQCTIHIDGKRMENLKKEGEEGEACLSLSLCNLDLEMLITTLFTRADPIPLKCVDK